MVCRPQSYVKGWPNRLSCWSSDISGFRHLASDEARHTRRRNYSEASGLLYAVPVLVLAVQHRSGPALISGILDRVFKLLAHQPAHSASVLALFRMPVAVYPACPSPLSAWRHLGSVATSSPPHSVTGCLASGCWPRLPLGLGRSMNLGRDQTFSAYFTTAARRLDLLVPFAPGALCSGALLAAARCLLCKSALARLLA